MIGKHLSLVMLSTTMDPSLYLDIPFSSFHDIEHSESQSQPLIQLRMSQSRLQCYLIIHLKVSKLINHYSNAKGSSVDSVTVVFDDPKDSRLVKDAISKRWSSAHGKPFESQLGERLGTHSMLIYQTEALDVSLNPKQMSEPGVNDTGALPAMASDAITLMPEEVLEPDELAASSADQYTSWYGFRTQPTHILEERPFNTDESTWSDVRFNGSTFPTSPFDSRVYVTRDSIDVSQRPAPDSLILRPAETLQDAPPNVQNLPPPKIQGTVHSTQGSGFTDAGQDQMSVTLIHGGQTTEARSAYDELYDVSPKPVKSGKPHQQGPAAAAESRSLVQKPLQASASKPKKHKLSQQMRNASGQTASGVEQMASEGSRNGQRGGNFRRLSQATETSFATTTKARPKVLPPPGNTATTKGSKATKKSWRVVEDENVVHAESVEVPMKPNEPRQARPAVQGSAASKMKIPDTQKTVTGKASFKPGPPTTQLPKTQVKRSHALKSTQRQIHDDTVNYDVALEDSDRSDDENDDKMRPPRHTKPKKRQKAAVNEKKAKNIPAITRPPKAKTTAVPLAAQKPRRSAAVKANKAIQGIVEDEAEEQSASNAHPTSPSLSPVKSPVSPRPTKAPTDGRPLAKMLPMSAPANAHIAVESAAIKPPMSPQSTKVSTDHRPPARKSPIPPLTEAPRTVESSGVRTSMAHPPAKSAANLEPSAMESVQPLTASAPMKIIPSAMKIPTAPLAAEDNSNIEASVPAKVFTVAKAPIAASDDQPGYAKGVEPSHSIPESVDFTEEVSNQSNRIHSFTEAKISASLDNHEKTLSVIDKAKPQPLAAKLASSKEGHQITAAKTGATTAFKNGGETTLFLEAEMAAGQLVSAFAASNDRDLPTESAQAHFDDAMAFAQPLDADLSSGPTQAPLPDHDVQIASTKSDNHTCTTQVTNVPIDIPAPVTKKFNARKLQSALSGVPQLHPERTDLHTIPRFSVPAAKAKWPATNTRTPEAKTLNASNSNIKPQVGQKRRQEQEEVKKAKKRRPILFGDDTANPRQQKHESAPTTPNASLPNVHRKPNLVHFEPTGPLNQGSSAGKPIGASVMEGWGKIAFRPEGDHKYKRKHFGDARDGPAETRLVPDKRQKVDHSNRPNHVVEHATVLPTRQYKANNTEQQRKASSQSSRVDAYGSPQPYHHSRTTSIAAPNIQPLPTSRQNVILDNDSEIDDDVDLYEDDVPDTPKLHLPRKNQTTTSPEAEPAITVPNNSKHRPSSPLAPSTMITDMTAHKEHPSGQFIDVRNADVVVPQKPQDPFAEAAHERPNSFMDLLRRSGDSHRDKGQTQRVNHRRVSNNANNVEDPEKTLIGASISDDEETSSTATETSSSSGGSPADDDPSDDGSGSGAHEWHDALKPHQSATLAVLIEISHVSRPLAMSEVADDEPACDQEPSQ